MLRYDMHLKEQRLAYRVANIFDYGTRQAKLQAIPCALQGCCNVFFAAFGGGEKRKKWEHPPRKEAAAPLTPAWQTVCPTLQQPCCALRLRRGHVYRARPSIDCVAIAPCIVDILNNQGFSKVAVRSDCSRLRRSQGEEGAGCGLRPQPAPSSPRLACEPFWMKRQRLRSPVE